MGHLDIYVDMDDVLCAFIYEACKRHGVHYTKVKPLWEQGLWDIKPPLEKALGKELNDDTFWQPLDSPEFWEGLLPHMWTDDLVRILNEYHKDNWFVLTRPGPRHSPHPYTGKVRWLKKYFGPHFDRFHITTYKHKFANSNSVLIDDSDANVAKFIEHGGHGIVFPRHHNKEFTHEHDPIRYVHGKLYKLHNVINSKHSKE